MLPRDHAVITIPAVEATGFLGSSKQRAVHDAQLGVAGSSRTNPQSVPGHLDGCQWLPRKQLSPRIFLNFLLELRECPDEGHEVPGANSETGVYTSYTCMLFGDNCFEQLVKLCYCKYRELKTYEVVIQGRGKRAWGQNRPETKRDRGTEGQRDKGTKGPKKRSNEDLSPKKHFEILSSKGFLVIIEFKKGRGNWFSFGFVHRVMVSS